VDGAGNIYIADELNSRVQKWAPGATAGVTVAGGNGQGSAANQLNGPEGVFVDGAGNVYVADSNNARVQKWAPGTTSGVTVAGGNGSGTAANQFSFAGSVFVDGAGDIYVTDAGKFVSRVQEWAPGAPSGVTVAGGDNRGSAANQLDVPGGVFVDANGDVYVADGDNSRVQEWQPGPSGAPLVTVDPHSQTVLQSANVTFSTGAIASPFPAVQWQRSTDGGTTWSDISGATSADDTITAVPLSDNGEQFRAAFTNAAGTATSDPATLTVNPVPTTSVLVPSLGVCPDCATLAGITYFDASASSGPVSVTRVQFEVTGANFHKTAVSTATPTLDGWIGSWNTTTVPNGSYALQSVATNSDGISATSNVTGFIVKNPPPMTKVIIPSNGATQAGGSALLDAVASVNVTSVRFELTGGSDNHTAISAGFPTLYGWLGQWNTTAVPNGTYTLQSVASYSGGVHRTSPPITITIAN
jgi:hypothetical protein